MTPDGWALVGLGWWAASAALHWTTAALAGRRRGPVRRDAARRSPADFSIVAPMSGAADASADYVKALLALSAAGAEVLICVARESDGAVAPVRAIWPDAPLLVGQDTTFNPKMNNVRKGLEAATRPFVALCDAGILLDAENLRRAALPLSDKIGLVLALKAGEAPGNFAAELERAYIDGHQARFLLAADRLGITVASGGVTLLSRETLDKIGNWRGFNRWIADDYSVTRSVRELGLGTTLGNFMVRLPLGQRRLSTVWERQVRWARTRLSLPVWPLVLWEPFIGWIVSGIAGALGLVYLGLEPPFVALGVVVHVVLWLTAEKWFMSSWGLTFGCRASVAALTREALAPLLMVRALSGRAIMWRGTDLGGQWRASGDEEASGRVPVSIAGASKVGASMAGAIVAGASGVATFKLPECVDSTTAAAIEQAMLGEVIAGGRLIVDGSDVTYMGAAGVRALATVLHRAEIERARIVFCSFSGPAADCLLVSGFSRLLDVVDSVEDANARLQSFSLKDSAESLRVRRTAG